MVFLVEKVRGKNGPLPVVAFRGPGGVYSPPPNQSEQLIGAASAVEGRRGALPWPMSRATRSRAHARLCVPLTALHHRCAAPLLSCVRVPPRANGIVSSITKLYGSGERSV